MDKKLPKEIRLNSEVMNIRDEEGIAVGSSKMIIEGYPIVFDKEAYIQGWADEGWYEKIDRNAFDDADMSDVCLKYNHNDDFLILARTRNDSLKLTVDDKGVFIHAELIDTTENTDIYKMVKAGLLQEGSFAFTVEDETEEKVGGDIHRTITRIGKLFDVAICTNGAYGNLTEIYARSSEKLENFRSEQVETEKRCRILKLKNKIKAKLMEGKRK